MRARRVRAFTLIELLVVIAIIAILAAILFPVFAQARDKARQAACLSNTKQMATAIMMYAQDYDEITVADRISNAPPGRLSNQGDANCESGGKPYAAWHDLIQPYVKNYKIYRCLGAKPTEGYLPTDGANQPPGNDPENLRWNYNINYIYVRGNCLSSCPDNPGGGTYPWVPHCAFGRSLASISEPADLIAILEGAAGPPDVRNSIEALRCRHGGGSNYVFADGHAGWKNFSQTLFPKFLWIDAQFATQAQMDTQRNSYLNKLRTNANLANCR